MADRIGILNDIVVAGVSLRDTYGIVPTGECVYNAPERDVEFIEVPGRNGDLIIDNGRFKNIEIKYPCSIAKDFPANVDGLRAFLASQLGYIRISDTYHPDEYRLGVYASGLETVNGTLNRVGSFDLVFNCMPQRFLTSGDEPLMLMQTRFDDANLESTPFIPAPDMPVGTTRTLSFKRGNDGAGSASVAVISYDANGNVRTEPDITITAGVSVDLSGYLIADVYYYYIRFSRTGISGELTFDFIKSSDSWDYETITIIKQAAYKAVNNETPFMARPLIISPNFYPILRAGQLSTDRSGNISIGFTAGGVGFHYWVRAYQLPQGWGDLGTETVQIYLDLLDKTAYAVRADGASYNLDQWTNIYTLPPTSADDAALSYWPDAGLAPGRNFVLTNGRLNYWWYNEWNAPFVYFYPRWWTI